MLIEYQLERRFQPIGSGMNTRTLFYPTHERAETKAEHKILPSSVYREGKLLDMNVF
jgi:hypothetical protein